MICPKVRTASSILSDQGLPQFRRRKFLNHCFAEKIGPGATVIFAAIALSIDHERIRSAAVPPKDTSRLWARRLWFRQGNSEVTASVMRCIWAGIEATDPAEMMIIAAILQKFGNGHLCQRRTGAGIDVFQKFNSGFEASGRDPADAIAGR